jgi:hypothetical protein
VNGANVENELERMLELLEASTEELALLSEAASEAESDAKLAWAKAYVQVEGKNAQEREANAMLFDVALYEGTASQPLHLWQRARREAEMQRDQKQEELRSIRASLDALRSLNTNMRAIV